jgi:hypothetical protein
MLTPRRITQAEAKRLNKQVEKGFSKWNTQKLKSGSSSNSHRSKKRSSSNSSNSNKFFSYSAGSLYKDPLSIVVKHLSLRDLYTLRLTTQKKTKFDPTKSKLMPLFTEKGYIPPKNIHIKVQPIVKIEINIRETRIRKIIKDRKQFLELNVNKKLYEVFSNLPLNISARSPSARDIEEGIIGWFRQKIRDRAPDLLDDFNDDVAVIEENMVVPNPQTLELERDILEFLSIKYHKKMSEDLQVQVENQEKTVKQLETDV